MKKATNSCVVLVCLLIGMTTTICAQSEQTVNPSHVAEILNDHTDDVFFDESFRVGGFSRQVTAVIEFSGDVIVAGRFGYFNNRKLNNIARLDAATQTWGPMGDGLNESVNALAVYNGELYAAGFFTQSGDSPARYVARWDETNNSWTALPGNFNGPAFDLIVHNEELYMGGAFSLNAGSIARRVVRWNADNQAWQEVGSGFGSTVYALASIDGELYAGGTFAGSGSTTIERIARFDVPANSWVQVGNGNPSRVDAITMHDGRVCIGGGTGEALAINHFVNCLNPDTNIFEQFGGIFNGPILDLHSFNGTLYGSGSFTAYDGEYRNGLARWNEDTESWHPVSGWTSGTAVVNVLTEIDNKIFAAGAFMGQEQGFQNIVSFNGINFEAVGEPYEQAALGTTGSGNALALHQGQLVAGGMFQHFGKTEIHTIAGLNISGNIWESFGDAPRVNLSPPQAVINDVISLNDQLYIAGGFRLEPGGELINVAGWNKNEQTWEAVGSGLSTENSFFYSVSTLGIYDGMLIAGGNFNSSGNTPVSRIAGFNFDSDEWEPFGAGVNASVGSITEYDGSLVIGGGFTESGETEINRVARWNNDGQVWEPLGAGFNGTVSALIVHEGKLYAGGFFTESGSEPVDHIARWNPDTETWHQVGSGLNSFVTALAVHNDRLVAGGNFLSDGNGEPLTRLAWWDDISGTWNPVGSGVRGGTPNAMLSHNATLYITGGFETTGNIGTGPFSAFTGTFTSVIEPATGLPTHIELKQNYPNPFNPVTTITYTLAEAGSVTLSVYDALGRRVAVLAEESRVPAGTHYVQFDASQLSSGVYLYRLQTGNRQYVRKMTFIK